jgi:hypothetical protein
MFPKLAIVATAALAIFAAAAPAAPLARRGGDVLCCDTKTASNSPSAQKILGLLGVVIDAVQSIGIDCLPIAVLGSVW